MTDLTLFLSILVSIFSLALVLVGIPAQIAKNYREKRSGQPVTTILIALCFYFASVVGLVWTAVSDITPYLLIPLIGTIILSWLILRLTAKLTSYTATGLQQRSAWLSFSQFLSDPNPIDPTMARNQTFEKYLAYSIALGKTAEWTNRFEQSSSTIVKPDWLVAYQELDAGALGGELVEFVSKTSKLLTTLRGPLVN